MMNYQTLPLTIWCQVCGGSGEPAGENGKPFVKGGSQTLSRDFYIFTPVDSFILGATSHKNWETRIPGYKLWKLPLWDNPHLLQLSAFTVSKPLPLMMTD
jgi:hypothetical protein